MQSVFNKLSRPDVVSHYLLPAYLADTYAEWTYTETRALTHAPTAHEHMHTDTSTHTGALKHAVSVSS